MPSIPPGAVVSIEEGGHRERFFARRDELVRAHSLPESDFVAGIARRVAASLPPSFDLDDLTAEGNAALLRVATQYKPSEHGGAPFSAYARKAIRGAILDSVSGRHYRNKTGVALLPEPVAPPPAAPEERLDRKRRLDRIAIAIDCLPKRHRDVMRGYYSADQPTQAEIGRRLRLSEGHVRNLHSEAVRAVRKLLA